MTRKRGRTVRRIPVWIACLMFYVGMAATLAAQTAVTLLGTGGPELTPERGGEATLVEAEGESLLFDAGRGVLDALYRSRVSPAKVTRIFLTHLHSDHIEGLPGLWMTPWFLLSRTTSLEVWGPPGTAAMIDGMRAMYAHDVERRANATFKREYLEIAVHEIGPGLVYERAGVRVSAIHVEHADGDPAFAYRIDTGKNQILLTGDCTFGDALTRGEGPLDLVVSNVVAGTAALESTPRLQPILAKLMRPEQAAMLFQRTAPRLAVYSHIVKKGLPGRGGDREILRRTRRAGYQGPLLMGQDHLRILLGRKIEVRRPGGRLPDFDGPASRF